MQETSEVESVSTFFLCDCSITSKMSLILLKNLYCLDSDTAHFKLSFFLDLNFFLDRTYLRLRSNDCPFSREAKVGIASSERAETEERLKGYLRSPF